MNKMSPLEYALEYIKRGWYVFPIWEPKGEVCSCPKHRVCQSPAKHPKTPAGHNGAAINESMVIDWWKRWPNANIGIVTGVRSKLVVIDVDPGKGGEDSISELIGKYGPFPDTVTVLTGGGGYHLYLKHPGIHIPCKNGWMPGIDIKADGGYVVAPPSLHISGGRYEWEASSRPKGVW
jgi:putative DNA primase/helicase